MPIFKLILHELLDLNLFRRGALDDGRKDTFIGCAKRALFSGRSNVPLAEKITHYLGVPLDEAHFSKFSNDNLFIQLGSSVRGRIVYIVQSLTPPVSDHLFGLLMMCDIAKSAGASEVHAIVPYFSYARSDKKNAPRISITARLIADLLTTAGATHIMTMTLHSAQVHGFLACRPIR